MVPWLRFFHHPFLWKLRFTTPSPLSLFSSRHRPQASPPHSLMTRHSHTCNKKSLCELHDYECCSVSCSGFNHGPQYPPLRPICAHAFGSRAPRSGAYTVFRSSSILPRSSFTFPACIADTSVVSCGSAEEEEKWSSVCELLGSLRGIILCRN